MPTKRLHVTGITLGLGCYTAADIGVTGGQQSFKRIRDTPDATYSDSILDRLVRNAFRINMNGDSMRQQAKYGGILNEEDEEK